MTDERDHATTVREFATRFRDRAFADATELLTDRGREAVVDAFPDPLTEPEMDAADALESYWRGLHGQYGDPEGIEVAVDEPGADGADGDDVGGDGVDDHGADGDDADENAAAADENAAAADENADATVAATVEFAFADGSETARVAVGDDGVADFAFDPEYEPPAYVDEDAFEARDVVVDAGDVDLDGVLTVPDGDAPAPGVVLVHGQGVHDPDGTVGASKILKDVAWGLATQGIASLRYEKRLAAHDVPDDALTLDRVVVDDAVAAVDALAGVDAVDADAVFVAGHSQGGMAAPRIAERHGDVAGVVSFDGSPTTGLDPEDADIIRYEFEVDGDLDEEQEAWLEDDRETFRRIQAGEFDDDETLMGRPGVWHRSLNAYDPAGTASALDAPVYVATTSLVDADAMPEMAAFHDKRFETWRDADLPPGSDVVQYDGVDHYFQAGYAPRMPMCVELGGNVAEHVVDDVSEWLHATAGR